MTFIDKELKWIPGFEGKYKVSCDGEVLSVSRKVRENSIRGAVITKEQWLSKRKDSKGYLRVYLNENGRTRFMPIHRLVALAFIPNPENKPQVNHIDGDKTNNNVKNLEWCTNSENQIHAYRLGLNKVSDKAGKPKIAVEKRDTETGMVIESYPSIAEASRKNNVYSSNISQAIMRKRKTCGGYIRTILFMGLPIPLMAF